MAKKTALIGAITLTVLVLSAVTAGVANYTVSNSFLTEQPIINVQDPPEDVDSLNNHTSENDPVENGTTQQKANAGAVDDTGTNGSEGQTGPSETITTLYVVPEPPFVMAMLSIFAASAAFLVHKKTRR